MGILHYFKKSEKGQGLVEYGLILALISIVSVSTLTGLGGNVTSTFANVFDSDSENIVDESYIEISNGEELAKIGLDSKYPLDGKYVQTADIDLSGYKGDGGWKPIGNVGDHEGGWSADDAPNFKGVYDGGNFEISGLVINRPSVGFQGLFGRTDGATIRNLKIEGANIISGSYGGPLSGESSRTTISNISSSGKVSGYNESKGRKSLYIGGLTGHVSRDSTISNSHANTDVAGSYAGGLTGLAKHTAINNSYSTGNVEGGSFVGGFVGYYIHVTVINSYSTGSVIGNDNVGGFIGGLHGSYSLINTYSSGKVTGRSGGNNVGGYSGLYSSPNDKDDEGNLYKKEIVSSYWDKTVSNQQHGIGDKNINSLDGLFGMTTVDMKDKTTYKNWDFNTTWEINRNHYPTLQ